MTNHKKCISCIYCATVRYWDSKPRYFCAMQGKPIYKPKRAPICRMYTLPEIPTCKTGKDNGE